MASHGNDHFCVVLVCLRGIILEFNEPVSVSVWCGRGWWDGTQAFFGSCVFVHITHTYPYTSFSPGWLPSSAFPYQAYGLILDFFIILTMACAFGDVSCAVQSSLVWSRQAVVLLVLSLTQLSLLHGIVGNNILLCLHLLPLSQ